MHQQRTMAISKRNHRRLLFAIIFIAINIMLLPFRIKAGLRRDFGSGSNANSYTGGAGSIKIGTAWAETYNPQHQKENNVRISFRLHDPKDEPPPDKFLSVGTFFCKDRAGLPPSLGPSDEGRLFDFTTTVSTNLNIIFIGDSLGHQFSQGFEAAVLGKGHEDRRNVHLKYHVKGKQFDCLVTSAPIRGGGVSAFWRYTKLLERSRKAKIMPCYTQERKWGENFLHTLLDHQYKDPEAKEGQPQSISGFDAVIVRIPYGWMNAEQLTKERIREAVLFCQEMLGARTVVFTTVGLSNNAGDAEVFAGVAQINQHIHEIAREWKPPEDGTDGVQWIMVQEFSNFTNAVLHENGKHLGYDVSTNDFFFERLKGGETSWPQSIPMVCANRPKDNLDSECKRNKISPDGIHWCIETLGARFTASIACLLGCVYNLNPPDTSPEGTTQLRKCEKDCNEQFMSLKRVDESLIQQGSTLYASAS
ncbi:hypothetical protein ACHAXT_001044 [Thalassiosira profunda]